MIVLVINMNSDASFFSFHFQALIAFLVDVGFFFFFLMIRRPPRSTLFPYTRSSDLRRASRWRLCCRCCSGCHLCRSEEHTSELQSHSDLVCRLLLEKKKKTAPRECHSTKQPKEKSQGTATMSVQ